MEKIVFEKSTFKTAAKAALKDLQSFSRALQLFKFSVNKDGILSGLKTLNKELAAAGKPTKQVTEEQAEAIEKIAFDKNLFYIVKNGFAQLDGKIVDTKVVETLDYFTGKTIKKSNKFDVSSALAGKSYKPFGYGANIYEYKETQKPRFVDNNHRKGETKISYLFEKNLFSVIDIINVVDEYIRTGCPSIQGKQTEIVVSIEKRKAEATTKGKTETKAEAAKTEAEAAAAKAAQKAEAEAAAEARKAEAAAETEAAEARKAASEAAKAELQSKLKEICTKAKAAAEAAEAKAAEAKAAEAKAAEAAAKKAEAAAKAKAAAEAAAEARKAEAEAEAAKAEAAAKAAAAKKAEAAKVLKESCEKLKGFKA